jgi:hypothetical protein
MKAIPTSVLALALLAAACNNHDDVVFIGTGVVVIDWTINGTKDPNACVALGANNIRVTILTPDGLGGLGDFTQLCEAFATSITLSAGDYAADAFLEDATAAPRTTVVQIAPFTIFGDDQITIPIDFPQSSFF